MLQKNMGTLDRSLRLLLGAALIFGALQMGYTWMWIGVIPLLTAVINTCPLYSFLGFKTCKDC